MRTIFSGNRIIVGTDFTHNAAIAADAAVAFAKKLLEGIILVHVHPKPPASDLKTARKRLGLLRDNLRCEAERLRKAGAVVEEKLIEGKPEQELGVQTQQPDTRCLFISSGNKTDLAHRAVGSTAEKIIETSKVPTFVIRSSTPFKAWAEGNHALRLWVGLHASFSSEAALRWIGNFDELTPSEITFGHVAHPKREAQRYGLDCVTPADSDGTLDLQELLERDLRRKVTAAIKGKPSRVRVHLTKRWTGSELVRLIEEDNADLVVVGAHGKRGAWSSSLTGSLIRRLPTNVICVPESTAAATQHAILPELKRVLIPTDFSILGNQAIPFAFSLLSNGGIAYLVHVLNSRDKIEWADMRFNSLRAYDEHKRQLNFFAGRLRELVPLAAENRGISVQTEVFVSDHPAEVICAATERFGADLVCMGSHGQGGLLQLTGGSVAKEVLAKSKKPVLLIPSAG
jgi:nucleotide-binding universal stress UspA family protein